MTLANLAPDLDLALSRQARMTEPNPGHATEAPLPFDQRVSETAFVVRSTLAGWVPEFTVAGQEPPGDLAPMAIWLLERAGRIAQHASAAECADEIASAAAEAMRVVDRPPERRYAGPCGECGQPLYVRPGKKTVTCQEHDPAWTGNVEERREWMLSEVSATLAHAALAVHLLDLLGVHVTPVQVTRWKQAGQLTPRGTDHEGRARYRIGDLIDLAATHGRTRRMAG